MAKGRNEMDLSYNTTQAEIDWEVFEKKYNYTQFMDEMAHTCQDSLIGISFKDKW